MKRLAGAVAAVVLAIALVPGKALAVSYPTVDDVNEWGVGKSVLTVTACGKGKLKLKATSGKRKLKVTRHRRGVWTVVVKNNKTVKLTVKDKNNKRSVGYRVFK